MDGRWKKSLSSWKFVHCEVVEGVTAMPDPTMSCRGHIKIHSMTSKLHLSTSTRWMNLKRFSIKAPPALSDERSWHSCSSTRGSLLMESTSGTPSRHVLIIAFLSYNIWKTSCTLIARRSWKTSRPKSEQDLPRAQHLSIRSWSRLLNSMLQTLQVCSLFPCSRSWPDCEL